MSKRARFEPSGQCDYRQSRALAIGCAGRYIFARTALEGPKPEGLYLRLHVPFVFAIFLAVSMVESSQCASLHSSAPGIRSAGTDVSIAKIRVSRWVLCRGTVDVGGGAGRGGGLHRHQRNACANASGK